MSVIQTIKRTPVGWSAPRVARNMLFWYDAAQLGMSGVYADAERIAVWRDLGPNEYNLEQTTAIKKPTFKTNIQNGLPAVLFVDGGNQEMMTTTIASIVQPATYFVALKLTATNTTDAVVDFNHTTNKHQIAQVANLIRLYAGATASYGTTTTNAAIFKCLFNGAASSIVFNGTSSGALNPNTNATDTTMGIGGNPATATGSGMHLFEVIAYKGAMDAFEIAMVTDYLSAKWGIATA